MLNIVGYKYLASIGSTSGMSRNQTDTIPLGGVAERLLSVKVILDLSSEAVTLFQTVSVRHSERSHSLV